MKFDKDPYWKHDKSADGFIHVKSSAFDENGTDAILYVIWCVQGAESWWFSLNDRIKITPKNYDRWKPYTPKGKMLL